MPQPLPLGLGRRRVRARRADNPSNHVAKRSLVACYVNIDALFTIQITLAAIPGDPRASLLTAPRTGRSDGPGADATAGATDFDDREFGPDRLGRDDGRRLPRGDSAPSLTEKPRYPTVLRIVAEPAQIHMLHFVHGKYRDREVPLAADKSYVLGRSSEVDLPLEDDTVSRRHARVFRERECLWIRDLGSRNGTFINGKRMRHARLRVGDRVAVGSSLMRVELTDPAKLIAAKPPAAAVDGPRARSMTGNIEEIHLSVVLQWLATSRKTGVLRVRGPGDGAIHLHEGQVYTARIEGANKLAPEKALFRILAWENGSFELETGSGETPSQDIEMALEHVLMEAARRQDELAHLHEKHTLPQDKVEVVLPAPKPWRELEPVALDVLQAFLDGSTWREVMDESTIDDLTLAKQIVALRRDGLVKY